MNTALLEPRTSEAAAYGGVIDALGGIATAVLAIVALTGIEPELLAGIATIVFGAALLIQGGALLSEYSHLVMPAAALDVTSDAFGGDGISAMFLTGASGIVLGILALLGVVPATLNAIAVIAFGTALMLSSRSVNKLYLMQSLSRRAALGPGSAMEFVAGEMASGSGGIQFLAGLAAMVLGIVAVSGVRTADLTFVALLILGVSLLMTGSTLSGLVMSFMRTTASTRG